MQKITPFLWFDNPADFKWHGIKPKLLLLVADT
jgi:hypothetical protein